MSVECVGGSAAVASVHLQNLTKKYGATTALQGLSLAVADGEFLVLVGPSVTKPTFPPFCG